MGHYKVTVATGSSIFSGTIDSIAIILKGVNGESDKQELSHLWIPGEVNDYEVDTKQDLGELLSVQLYKNTYLFFMDDAWYCRDVTVTAPNEKIYHFPVYQWISGETSVVIPEGTASMLSMSSSNVYQGDRTKILEQCREIYTWKLYAPGVPHCISADGLGDLPVNEQYSDLKKSSFQFTRISSLLEVGLKGLLTSTDSWKNLDDIKSVFLFNKTDNSDKVSHIWNEDSFFGDQYLNGVNPMLIRKCLSLPENFPVSNSMVAQFLGSSTNLDKELQSGHIFLADYKILQGIPANPSINGRQQYIAAPMCLLWKDAQDQLLPIAIQLGQTPRDQTPIFLPSDSKWDWTLAKIWVRNSEFQVHQTVYHLLYTHLFTEVFNIATHRQLPPNHPVYKLLIPHLRFTLDINTRARTDLICPGGVFDQIMVIGNGGMNHLLRKGMEEVTYSALCLPEDIESRGLESIPYFFYRDDGRLIWDAVESFVSGIVNYYYKSDESVRTDPELQAWVAEIYEKGFLSSTSSGIPSSLETVPALVKYLNMMIFRCSAQHAAVNSGQYDLLSWMPNGPSSMKSPPPTTKGVTTRQSILNALPDVSTTTKGLVAVWQLSMEPLDRRHLGYYPDEHFTEETPKKCIQEFQENLAEISKIINERNQSRKLSYLYLDPKQVENSVSI